MKAWYVCYALLAIILFSCKLKVNPSESRIYVVQEVKLDDKSSFFWFRNQQQVTHEGLSYFQIATNRCDLSVENANAYCQMPEQILNIERDTVFILTKSEIELIKRPPEYFIKTVEYANELFDLNKKPKKESMYFLDTVCK